MAWLLFAFLLAVYHLNGDFLPGNDAKPNAYLAVSLLSEGNLSFAPREMPFMFGWDLETETGVSRVYINSWEDTVGGRKASELRESGALTLGSARYYVVPSVREGLYVGVFGPGPGLAAVPVLGVLHLVTGDLVGSPRALWHGAKFVASAMVAASAVFVFLAALRFTGKRRALLVALAYGLGTCVWSVSSQSLWQHGPNEFFLALGTYFLTRIATSRRCAAWCGLAYAAAVVCRPTSAIVVAAVGVYLLIADRKALLLYVLAGLPIAVLLGSYNAYYLGSPFSFGQAATAAGVAQFKTGSAELWQTPLWRGALGLMVSPSRGLLVYSPFMAFAIWGLWLTWRQRRYAPLRPLTVAVVALLGLAFKWFDWWGGWCFGYRPIVDTMPLLALLLVPALDPIGRRRWLKGAFAALLAWSALVQVTGAFAYNVTGWNERVEYELRLPERPDVSVTAFKEEAQRLIEERGARLLGTRRLNVDRPEHRHRLWSVADSQMLYYLRRFGEARELKRKGMADALKNPAH